jgi:hypothetical protein
VSRGHGEAQRFILWLLAEHPGKWWSAWDLAQWRWNRKPTQVEVQSIRNAMRRLEGTAGVDVRETEEYWGVIGQLKDAEDNWRPKRVFPTLVIGRDVPERDLQHEPVVLDAGLDPGF